MLICILAVYYLEVNALIVVAAAGSGAEVLYSEDLSHGQTIAGVEVINPFR
jgi:predicted nucleic acid-binding protein